MKRTPQLLFIKFIAALASIAYELILAQTLSAFLSNTVLRYCVTIGLYMFFMGVGAFFVERKLERAPAATLWLTEAGLTLLGASAVPFLFAVDALHLGAWPLLIAAHVLICLIGFLTGFELPLALELASGRRDGRPGRNTLFAADYLGAFAGTAIFALLFYPRLGLVASAWAVSLLNALAALVLALSWKETPGKGRIAVWASAGLILLTLGGLWTAAVQEKFLIG
ncbi:MAG: hypothetical protein HGA80_09650, partial [Candidatus Omnitrophica bacterium]|nr:hypothetical protein [Candidatus Omnitrophota bacterium]